MFLGICLTTQPQLLPPTSPRHRAHLCEAEPDEGVVVVLVGPAVESGERDGRESLERERHGAEVSALGTFPSVGEAVT